MDVRNSGGGPALPCSPGGAASPGRALLNTLAAILPGISPFSISSSPVSRPPTPPRGSSTSPAYRGMMWRWRFITVWPAAARTFAPTGWNRSSRRVFASRARARSHPRVLLLLPFKSSHSTGKSHPTNKSFLPEHRILLEVKEMIGITHISRTIMHNKAGRCGRPGRDGSGARNY